MAKVFISYSHDSKEHRERVLALSERLRADGVETILDQYVNGTPEQGWPRWMLDHLDAANYVLVVCTETYYRRFRGHEVSGKGKGVDWEGALITMEIYNARSKTLKFVPIFLSERNESWIPEPLRTGTHYWLTSEDAYQSLYDFLLQQSGVEPGPVGKLRTKSRKQGSPLKFEAGTASTRRTPWAASPAPAVDSYNLGLRLLRDEDYDAALDALNRAIELDPALGWAYYNRGLAHYFRRDDDPAIRDFDHAIELGLHEAIVFRNRANAFSRKGDVTRALADYAQAIALEPENPVAYLNRGEVYENTLKKAEAVADYKAVLNLVAAPDIHDIARARLRALGVRPVARENAAALDLWQKKLAFLQTEEAKASDADQKFSIQQRIEEAQGKIQELGG